MFPYIIAFLRPDPGVLHFVVELEKKAKFYLE
jgi:hypothetical protein